MATIPANIRKIDIESILKIAKEHMRRRGLPQEIIESVLEDVRNDADQIAEEEPARISPPPSPTPAAKEDMAVLDVPAASVQVSPLSDEQFSPDFGDEGNSPSLAAALEDLASLSDEPKTRSPREPREDRPVYDSYHIVCCDPEHAIPDELRTYFEGFLIKCVSGTSAADVPKMLNDAGKNINSMKKYRRDPLSSIGEVLADGPGAPMAKAGFRVVNKIPATIHFVNGKI